MKLPNLVFLLDFPSINFITKTNDVTTKTTTDSRALLNNNKMIAIAHQNRSTINTSRSLLRRRRSSSSSSNSTTTTKSSSRKTKIIINSTYRSPKLFIQNEEDIIIADTVKTKNSPVNKKNNTNDEIVITRSSTQISLYAIATNFMIAKDAIAKDQTSDDLKQFLVGFWNFRTGDVTSIILYTVLPIAIPYLIFSRLQKDKTKEQIEKLEKGGWVEFMLERELDVNILTLVQINAFVQASEKGVLDDAMVLEFVRQLKLNEQWKKSTINVEDSRASAATRKARARAILEARIERDAKNTNNGSEQA